MFAGGPAPLIAAALLPISIWLIAAYIAIMAAITLIATSMLPDRTHADLTHETHTSGMDKLSGAWYPFGPTHTSRSPH